MAPTQHGHELHLGFEIGASGLQLLLTVGLVTVVAAALAGPFLPPASRRERSVLAAIAAASVVLLLLGGRTAAPNPLVVGLLAAALLPWFATRRPALPWAGPARRLGPWVVVAAAAGTAAGLLQAVVGSGDDLAWVRTALLAGVVGLAWLPLCRARTRRSRTALQVLGWVLGHAVLAGGTAVLVAAVPA